MFCAEGEATVISLIFAYAYYQTFLPLHDVSVYAKSAGIILYDQANLTLLVPQS